MTKELLLGCGNSREKKLYTPMENTEWHDLVTLDFDPACKPDVLHDLNGLHYPFENEEFDEIHAYEVLEHLGRQGDWRFFFNQFAELHRIIKPSGLLFATCPHYTSPWAWGDPSHTRIIGLEQITFLSQRMYAEQVGKTAMTDFRAHYNADWELAFSELSPNLTLMFALKAVK